MRVTACPCCGQTTTAVSLEAAMALLSPIVAEVVGCLSKRPGEFVRTSDIAAQVWRRDPNGGPENFGICISSAIARNRHRLQALGWEIESRFGQPGGYRLRIIEEAVA